MRKNIFLQAIVLVVSIIIIIVIVLVAQKPVQEPESPVAVMDAPTVNNGKSDSGSALEKQDRVPSRFVCVGEYCDGSMSGDDYRDTYTVLQIPLITDGGTIGCGAQLFFAPHAVPKTTGVLDATYRLLFDLKPTPEIPSDGFRNVVGAYTGLRYDRVTLQDGTARLYLTGAMRGPGHCAEPELRAQIDQAALQFATVKKLEVYLNDKIFDWCITDVSDGEGPCPEKPQLWITKKQ